jgi:hypothetical protein
MINHIRQYPRVKQRIDRTFAPSPANSLLYILSAIRELYNSSNDGRSASTTRDLGYDQLVAFLYIDMRTSEDEIEQHLRLKNHLPGSRQLNGVSDFVRWSTSHVWAWVGTSDERITIALETLKPVEERFCLESMEWQKTVEEDSYMSELEAKRFSTLLSLLKDSFGALIRHHAAVTNYHHSLGFREIEMVIEEADMTLEPYHQYHSEAWSWFEHERHAKMVEETLPMLLAVVNGDGETASCFRVEYALLLFLPLMPLLVDVAYDLIPG